MVTFGKCTFAYLKHDPRHFSKLQPTGRITVASCQAPVETARVAMAARVTKNGESATQAVRDPSLTGGKQLEDERCSIFIVTLFGRKNGKIQEQWVRNHFRAFKILVGNRSRWSCNFTVPCFCHDCQCFWRQYNRKQTAHKWQMSNMLERRSIIKWQHLENLSFLPSSKPSKYSKSNPPSTKVCHHLEVGPGSTWPQAFGVV